MEAYPHHRQLKLLHTHAMVRSGALEEARTHLNLLYDEITHSNTISSADPPTDEEEVDLSQADFSNEELEQILHLAEALRSVGGDATADTEEDIVRTLGDLFKEAWRRTQTGEDLLRARNLLLQAYHRDPSLLSAAIAAAWLSWVQGDHAQSTSLAKAAVAASPDLAALVDAQDFAALMVRGQGLLLLGDQAAALGTYTKAVEVAGDDFPLIVNALQELKLYQEQGFPVPATLLDILKPPVVVILAGTPLDSSITTAPCFPPTLEAAVGREIREAIDALNPRVAFCSASCGADLLFIEALLERDTEINVVLPFHLEDFLDARVRYAGSHWEKRFRHTLQRVHSIVYATEERYLGHDVLFTYCNQVLIGEAFIRAAFLETEPYLLAVWDFGRTSSPGSASDLIDHWSDILRLRMVDLDELRDELPAEASHYDGTPLVNTPPPPESLPRAIKAMLFGDVVGYSRLNEEHLPRFRDCLDHIAQQLDQTPRHLDKLESWGDALFVVMPTATTMAEYALHLQQIVEAMDPEKFGLPVKLRFRVGLHAGPVFEATDPLTRRLNFYGGHVNQAARIEPVTAPGQVYASKQFIALLEAEESATRHALESTGERYEARFEFDYLGILPLAKKYGQKPVYHLKLRPGIWF